MRCMLMSYTCKEIWKNDEISLQHRGRAAVRLPLHRWRDERHTKSIHRRLHLAADSINRKEKPMSEKDTIFTPEMDEELSNGKGDDEDE